MSNHKEFKVSQQIVLQNDAGNILILEKTGNGLWLLPGGRIDEEDRDLEEALSREVKEEIGIEITVGRPLAVDTATHWNTFAIAFLATAHGPFEPTLSAEHSAYKWVSPLEASELLYYKRIGKAIKEQLG